MFVLIFLKNVRYFFEHMKKLYTFNRMLYLID
jgi:hypothetical protein